MSPHAMLTSQCYLGLWYVECTHRCDLQGRP